MTRKDEELTRFLQDHAPIAPPASQELEDSLFRAIADDRSRVGSNVRRRAWSMVSSAVAAAAVIAGIVWFRHPPAEPLSPIATDLEKSWDGVLADNQDLGLQSLFSDLD